MDWSQDEEELFEKLEDTVLGYDCGIPWIVHTDVQKKFLQPYSLCVRFVTDWTTKGFKFVCSLIPVQKKNILVLQIITIVLAVSQIIAIIFLTKTMSEGQAAMVEGQAAMVNKLTEISNALGGTASS